MGLHYVNMSLVGDGEVDVTQPEIVLFEPTRTAAFASLAPIFWCSPRTGTQSTMVRRS